MPQFYFHLRKGDEFIIDDEGLDLPVAEDHKLLDVMIHGCFAGFAFAGPRQARVRCKGLAAVKPGVKLQRRIRDLQTGPIKCLLEAAQVLRHAVD